MFNEIFKILGLLLYVPAIVVSLPSSLMQGNCIFSTPNDIVRGLASFGRNIDNKLYLRNQNGYKIQDTGLPGTGISYTYTDPSGGTSSGYYFDTYFDMVNFMWIKSEELNVEISGYILTDGEKEYYWVNDWNGNTCDKSSNPYYVDTKHTDYVTFDNKRIIGQIHTHPSCNYSSNPNGYDGPSYQDYIFSKKINAPVYTVGPKTVSMIIYSKSDYSTSEDFDKLAKGNYNPMLIIPESRINPFLIIDNAGFLAKPYYYKYWGRLIKDTW